MHKIGIIAEYNPFHNGHLYQIKEIKKNWNDEYKELIKDYKANKIKSYKDAKKMHQDILNGQI